MKKLLGTLSIAISFLVVGCSTTNNSSKEYKEIDADKIPDPVPKHEPKSKYGNMRSYEVFGKTYYIRDSAEGFSERGQASWYGHPFHGRRTSSGEPYDMYQMTAAHKTVPIPSYMQVTNLETGKSIIVRVNDRGPFHDDRVIDLSYAAAKKLGAHAKGTIPVEISTVVAQQDVTSITINTSQPPVRNVSTPAPQNNSKSGIFLQVASFSSKSRAEDMVQGLKQLPASAGLQIESGYNQSNQPIYRVQIGPFPQPADAQQYTQYVTQKYPDVSPIVLIH